MRLNVRELHLLAARFTQLEPHRKKLGDNRNQPRRFLFTDVCALQHLHSTSRVSSACSIRAIAAIGSDKNGCSVCSGCFSDLRFEVANEMRLVEVAELLSERGPNSRISCSDLLASFVDAIAANDPFRTDADVATKHAVEARDARDRRVRRDPKRVREQDRCERFLWCALRGRASSSVTGFRDRKKSSMSAMRSA